MKLKLIIVSPKYQMNAGYIARVALNFGIKELSFISPRANIKGKKAIMYSKHAVELLKKAKTYKTLEEAVRGCDIVVGTSGILRQNSRFDNFMGPEDAVVKITKEYKDPIVGLLIGRDDTGLSFEELMKCDIVVHIESNKEYPILNISHALAVILYMFTHSTLKYTRNRIERPDKTETITLGRMFDEMIKNKPVRDKKEVRNIFDKMVRRAQLSKHELHAVITAFK